MVWVDIAILVIIAISAIISIVRGLVLEVLSLLAWVAAFAVAILFFRDLAGMLESHVSAALSLRLTVAFLILLIGTLLVAGIINYLIAKLISKTGLSGTDRALGSIFGILRGLFIVQILVLLAGFSPFPEDPWWRESTFLRHFEPVAYWIVDYLPGGLAEYFGYSPAQE